LDSNSVDLSPIERDFSRQQLHYFGDLDRKAMKGVFAARKVLIVCQAIMLDFGKAVITLQPS
jgi:hypothetical protein